MWKAYRHWKGFVEVHDPITATVATVAGAAISAGSTIMGGNAAADAGVAQQQAAAVQAEAQRKAAADNATALEFKATQEDQGAQESRASSQRQALEKSRQARLLLSTLQARAAASGGGASDPGVVDIAGKIAARGEYESLTDMYTGENRARGLMDQAKGDRFAAATGIEGGELAAKGSLMQGEAARRSGQAQQSASYLSAAGTIVGSAGSAYRTYNGIGSGKYG